MATYTRGYTPTNKALIDPLALADEFDRIAVAHNANNVIIEGRGNLEFDAGFQVSYDSTEYAWAKYVSIVDAGSDAEHSSFALTESDATFQRLTIPATSVSVADSAAYPGIAKAWHFGVTLRAGSDNTVSDVDHPANGNDANEIIIREDSYGLTASLSAGHHPFLISNDTVRTLAANEVAYAEVVVRNMASGSSYATTAPFYVQVRCGTDAGGFDGAGGDAGRDSDVVQGLRLLYMSTYTPSYKKNDRWLSRGIPLDSTKLDTELDNVATAINTGNLGGADLTFEPGWGIIYDRNEHATGKFACLDDASSGNDLISVNIESTTGITYSDTSFNFISLATSSTAYGSKWMHLGFNFYFNTTAPGVRHPAHASYADSLGLVIREQSDVTDPESGKEGHHPLGVAADTDFSTTATGVHYRSLVMRNINQGFAIRIGSGLTIGTGSRLLVRVTGLAY